MQLRTKSAQERQSSGVILMRVRDDDGVEFFRNDDAKVTIAPVITSRALKHAEVDENLRLSCLKQVARSRDFTCRAEYSNSHAQTIAGQSFDAALERLLKTEPHRAGCDA